MKQNEVRPASADEYVDLPAGYSNDLALWHVHGFGAGLAKISASVHEKDESDGAGTGEKKRGQHRAAAGHDGLGGDGEMFQFRGAMCMDKTRLLAPQIGTR